MKKIQIIVASDDFPELKDAFLTVIMDAGIDAIVKKAEEFNVFVFVTGKIVEEANNV